MDVSLTIEMTGLDLQSKKQKHETTKQGNPQANRSQH